MLRAPPWGVAGEAAAERRRGKVVAELLRGVDAASTTMGSTFVLHGGRRRGGVEVGGGEADLRLAGPLPRRSPFPAGFEGDHGDHVRPDHDGPLQKFCEFLWCSHSNLLCRSFRDLHFKRKMLPSVAFFERCWSWRWRWRCSALTRFVETLAHKLRFREGTQLRRLKVVVRRPSRDAAASYAHAELCRIEHQEDDVLAGSADLRIEPSAWVEAHAGEARLISAWKHGVLWLPSSGWEDMVDGE